MAFPYFILNEHNQQQWDDIISTIPSFVADTGSDCDSTYDYVVNHLESPFIENKQCWDEFYDKWADAFYHK